MASALFAILPLTLRYALEARPYMPAVFFSIVLTLLFLELAERPSLLVAFAFCRDCGLDGVYTTLRGAGLRSPLPVGDALPQMAGGGVYRRGRLGRRRGADALVSVGAILMGP